MTDTIDRIHPDLRSLALPIDSLYEDPRNANEHDAASLTAIASSFIEFGQRKPIVVRREGMIVEAGNGTLAALREAGWTHLACVVCDDDEQRAIAYGLADNQAARHAKWNFGQLRENVEATLAGYGEVLGNMWTGDQLANILAGKAAAFNEQINNTPTQEPEAKPDPKPEHIPVPSSEPITKPGDVWIMGNHRLICGDCRDPEVVARLLDGEKINVAFTSPPYASQRKYDESSGFKPIHPDEFVDWFEAVQANVRAHLANDGSWFVNIKEHCENGERHLYVKDLTISHKRRWNWRFVDELCWERIGLPGRYYGRFKNAWEPVFHFSILQASEIKFNAYAVGHASDSIPVYSLSTNLNPVGSLTGITATRKQVQERAAQRETRSGIAIPSNRIPPFTTDSTEHSAAFPVGLPSFFIKAYSDEEDAIYDPFSGSGTLIIACERLGRRGYGCESSRGYCDVIVTRWENETGRKAERL